MPSPLDNVNCFVGVLGEMAQGFRLYKSPGVKLAWHRGEKACLSAWGERRGRFIRYRCKGSCFLRDNTRIFILQASEDLSGLTP